MAKTREQGVLTAPASEKKPTNRAPTRGKAGLGPGFWVGLACP
eukprot:CAMPEP_0174365340 /NCGR_PEP_ID=MMETSP0811_2-20130205/76876_1 /TAXON_ID=73025 ORGANISM="Eutreptiella gymnastica-like, Strain CCMP1594" /NCGR_SAMPLE_ID=MMETSP0811_2 /ASSEMBLY_ACC=CAM_ASM_000667 /LENGTH=42 /DNA_ID= /DNA_START= /DNA_END= /DNA_ORIENTATION=